MIEAEFWSQQTALFIEQATLLQQPPLQLMPVY